MGFSILKSASLKDCTPHFISDTTNILFAEDNLVFTKVINGIFNIAVRSKAKKLKSPLKLKPFPLKL